MQHYLYVILKKSSFVLHLSIIYVGMLEEHKQERTIIHLEINNNHYYYGSIKALCINWDKGTIGVTYNYLKNYGLSIDKPYKNKSCIIRKGIIITIPKKENKIK